MAVRTLIEHTEGMYFITFTCQQLDSSFEITSHHFFLQKLSYLHDNPCSAAWELIKNSDGYKHTSAKLYLSGQQGLYLIKEG
ncbi:MAG: hypothetical protein ACR2KX_13735 [Chitinophagaceae bacterium]